MESGSAIGQDRGMKDLTQGIATYRVLRNGISVLSQPVFGPEVVLTGTRLNQNSLIISDAELEVEGLRYLRLIDGSGWVVDDSKVSFLSLLNCGEDSLMRVFR